MISEFKKEKIILASKSPRRRQLMDEAGFNFEVLEIDVDESYPDDMSLEIVPLYIAENKAKEGVKTAPEGSLIIAADCIVLFDNEILEKPKSREEAISMISRMNNRSHKVISGVCIQKGEKRRSFTCTTKVSFGELSDEEIKFYVDEYQPFDKAGSYGIQEWIGHCKVKHLEGSYTNVMGLPMYELYHNLAEFFEL